MSGSIKTVYEFNFDDGIKKTYTVELHEKTLTLVQSETEKPGDWAKLDNQKCSHCTLKSKKHPYCPIAANMDHIAEFFKDRTSVEKVKVDVFTQERTYSKPVQLQQGIFSLFGLIMSTSGCPHMNFLKPMARFHLPFSTERETIVRSISLYLMKQYFIHRKGGKPDISLTQLEKHYDQVKEVNIGFIARLRTIARNDADVNAMVILHSFSELLTMAIEKDIFDIEDIFNSDQTL